MLMQNCMDYSKNKIYYTKQRLPFQKAAFVFI